MSIQHVTACFVVLGVHGGCGSIWLFMPFQRLHAVAFKVESSNLAVGTSIFAEWMMYIVTVSPHRFWAPRLVKKLWFILSMRRQMSALPGVNEWRRHKERVTAVPSKSGLVT